MLRSEPTPWLFVADLDRARLLRARWRPGGRVHLELEAEIKNGHAEHEHGRPSPRTGRDGHSYASWGHERETITRRWAKEIAGWLHRESERRRLEREVLLASIPLLGELRKHYSNSVRGRLEEIRCSVAHLDPGVLARHRVVLRVLTNEPAA